MLLQDYVLKRAHAKASATGPDPQPGARKYVHESRIHLKALHKRFIEACRKHHLEERGQYPFTTKKLGYEALSNYVRRPMERNLESGAKAMAYNIKRMTNILGATKLTEALHQT